MITGRDTILEFLNALWGRRWYAIAVAWLVCLAGWSTIAVMPDQYAVSARIYVDTSSILKPLLRGIAVEPNIEQEVRLIRQTLLSRANVEKVMRMTDLDLDVTTEEQKNKLIESLQRKTILSSPRREKNLFSIDFQHNDPTQARDIVQAFTTVFVENNIGKNRDDADAAREFLDEQTQFYREQLEDGELRLANFQREYGRLLPESSGNIVAVFKRTQKELNEAVSLRDELRRQLATVEPTIEVSSGAGGISGGPPTLDEVQIAELESVVENLLSRYTENHPDVVVANRRLAAMKERVQSTRASFAELHGEDQEQTNTVRESNPLYAALKLQLIQAEAQIGILKQRLDSAKVQFEEVRERVEMAPLLAAEQQKLQRDSGIVKRKYEQLLERRESMKIATKRSIKSDDVKFRIIEPPVVPTKPVGPNRPLFLSIALVFGLGVGVVTAALLVFTRHTFQNARALKSTFSIPVYGAVRDLRKGLRRGKAYLDFIGVGLASGGLVATLLLLLLIENRIGLPNIASLENAPQSIEQLKILFDEGVTILGERV